MFRSLGACLSILLISASGPALARQVYPIPAPIAVPAPAPKAPLLPLGPLLRTSAGKSTFFIVQDTVVRSGAKVDYWVYIAHIPEVDLGGRFMAQTMQHDVIDCEAKTFSRIISFAYDKAGKQIDWLPAQPTLPVEPGWSYYYQYRVLCENEQLPAENLVVSSEVAMATALQLKR